MAFLPGRTPGTVVGRVSVGAVTDNQSVQFALAKLVSTKFPLIVFVAELAVQLEANGWQLQLGWVPREQNVEADAITNDVFDEFRPANRVVLDPSQMPWLVLPQLLDMGQSFFDERDRMREKRAADPNRAAPAPKRPHKLSSAGALPFRVKDPW
jgi:hypothetical protein